MEAESKRIEKEDANSQGAQDCGQPLSTEFHPREYRFVAKDGVYATPWRSMPKDGIIGHAINRMKDGEKLALGSGFSLQMRS